MVIKHGFQTTNGHITDAILLDVDQSVINKMRCKPYHEYMKWKLSRLNSRIHQLIGSKGDSDRWMLSDNQLMFIHKAIKTTTAIINENR